MSDVLVKCPQTGRSVSTGLTTDMNHSRKSTTPPASAAVPGLRADAQMGAENAWAANGRHVATGRASASISPEGIAVSPDSRYIVAASLTRNFFPWDDERLTIGGALDRLTLEPETGALSHIEAYRL